jgi:hypothetical protein
LNHDPPDLCLLSSWDYRREPSCGVFDGVVHCDHVEDSEDGLVPTNLGGGIEGVGSQGLAGTLVSEPLMGIPWLQQAVPFSDVWGPGALTGNSLCLAAKLDLNLGPLMAQAQAPPCWLGPYGADGRSQCYVLGGEDARARKTQLSPLSLAGDPG